MDADMPLEVVFYRTDLQLAKERKANLEK